MRVDATPLGLCMALVVTFRQIAALLTIPYISRIYEERSDGHLWGNWFRLFTFILCFFAAVLVGAGIYLRSQAVMRIALGGLIVTALAVIYNVLFGIMVPQLSLCADSLEDVCMESGGRNCAVTLTQRGTPVKTWEAVLFSLSLCVLLVCIAPTIDRACRLAFPKRVVIVQEDTLGNLNSDFETTANMAAYEVPKMNVIRTDVNPIDSSTISFDRRSQLPNKNFNIPTTKKGGASVAFKTRPIRK